MLALIGRTKLATGSAPTQRGILTAAACAATRPPRALRGYGDFLDHPTRITIASAAERAA